MSTVVVARVWRLNPVVDRGWFHRYDIYVPVNINAAPSNESLLTLMRRYKHRQSFGV